MGSHDVIGHVTNCST